MQLFLGSLRVESVRSLTLTAYLAAPGTRLIERATEVVELGKLVPAAGERPEGAIGNGVGVGIGAGRGAGVEAGAGTGTGPGTDEDAVGGPTPPLRHLT